MRIAIGGLIQEVNAFSPVPTRLADFTDSLRLGRAVIDDALQGSEIAAFVDTARAAGDVELVPLLSAYAMPAGKVEEAAYRFLRERFLEGLAKAGPLDGILLSLHGAMASDDAYDVEGDLLEAIRHARGARIPIAVSLDHHGNITTRMVECANALIGYHKEPHLDAYETGCKTARILFRAARTEIRPVLRWRRIPMIASGNLLSPAGPLGRFFAAATAYEEDARVLSASIFPGFAWADHPELGWSVVVVTDNAPALAQRIADELAVGLWESRREFLPQGWPSPAEAVERALRVDGGPVILADYGDMTTGGAPGDSTAILQSLLGRTLPGQALLTIVDPEAVHQASAAGVGQHIEVPVGGTLDPERQEAVRVHGTVRRITDGRYLSSLGGESSATPVDQGQTVVLEVGDIFIVLSERSGPVVDPALYRSVGLEPAQAKIVVVKSGYSFRAAYEPMARSIIVVNSPGASTPDLRRLEPLYRLAPRPLFPLDEDATFTLERTGPDSGGALKS